MHRINDPPGKRAPVRPPARSRLLESREIRRPIVREEFRRKETIAARVVVNDALPKCFRLAPSLEEIPPFPVLVESN